MDVEDTSAEAQGPKMKNMKGMCMTKVLLRSICGLLHTIVSHQCIGKENRVFIYKINAGVR